MCVCVCGVWRVRYSVCCAVHGAWCVLLWALWRSVCCLACCVWCVVCGVLRVGVCACVCGRVRVWGMTSSYVCGAVVTSTFGPLAYAAVGVGWGGRGQ